MLDTLVSLVTVFAQADAGSDAGKAIALGVGGGLGAVGAGVGIGIIFGKVIGRRITGPQSLKPGDTIELGTSTIGFDLD